MARYVDGYVLPVPKKNIAAYRRMARLGSRVWRDHGALEYVECVADDFKVKAGISFPRLVRPKSGETIVFAWIVYKSKAHRNRVNAAVMKDPRMAEPPKFMPFDWKRMAYGGFKAMVDA